MRANIERILIVGLGSIGQRHARVARGLFPNATIVALRRAVGDECEGIDHQVTTLDEALAFDPDVAVIASPAPMHLDSAIPLAKHGVDLLVEKPLASSSARVRHLLDAVDATGATLLVGYNLRFAPSLVRLRELVIAGRVGRALNVRAEVGQYLPGWRPSTDYRTGVSARRSLGGGVLLELSHEIDYLRWLFGEVESVSATLDRVSDLEIDVEDTAHLVLGFRGTGGTVFHATLSMDFVRRDSTRSCTVIGDCGTLRWNAIDGTVDVFDEGGPAWTRLFSHPPARDETYVAEWRHFVACVSGHDKSLITGADGLGTLHVIDAARRSHESKSVVALELPVPVTGGIQAI